MTDNKICQHDYRKIGEEIRQYIDINWNDYYCKVYIMCCSKCGKTIVVKGE